MMTIRQAQKSDLESISDLITRTVTTGESVSGWDSNYPTIDIFIRDIDSGHLYLYENNNKISGIIAIIPGPDADYKDIIWEASGKALILHRLCVDPSYRKQGIASGLMQYAETFARREKYKSLQLDTRECNSTAIALYKKLGYKQTGIITRDRGTFFCYEKVL